jgi:hypothetical protein
MTEKPDDMLKGLKIQAPDGTVVLTEYGGELVINPGFVPDMGAIGKEEMTPEADDDTVHIVEEGGEFFCVRQGCGTRRGPFTTKTAALAAAYVLTGLIDQNPSQAIAAGIGPCMTGRISSPDGSTFIDFNNMTCDPKTFARLEADGLTHGLRPVDPATSL